MGGNDPLLKILLLNKILEILVETLYTQFFLEFKSSFWISIIKVLSFVKNNFVIIISSN